MYNSMTRDFELHLGAKTRITPQECQARGRNYDFDLQAGHKGGG